jgi:Flp pilus assembly CpaE family ATPase
MGAPSLARRRARGSGARASADAAATPTISALAFHDAGGPLVAVVALCGGAGASTITALTGLAAARASSVPVLAADTGGPTGGLAAYTGAYARHSLADGSTRIAEGVQLVARDLTAVGPDGLRVMAAAPDLAGEGAGEVVDEILADARHAHGLTLIDCGTLARPLERRVMGQATHVLWIVPATVSGVRRARHVLRALGAHVSARETVVARHDAGERRAPMRELTNLAAERHASLVLVPHVPDLVERAVDEAIEAGQVALQAIGEQVRR